MIGSLRGKVIFKDGLILIVETAGVGYRVLVSEKTSSQLHQDKEAFIYIYTHVREDSLDLFGFLEAEDLKLFENQRDKIETTNFFSKVFLFDLFAQKKPFLLFL